jgi:hypothetical protein
VRLLYPYLGEESRQTAVDEAIRDLISESESGIAFHDQREVLDRLLTYGGTMPLFARFEAILRRDIEMLRYVWRYPYDDNEDLRIAILRTQEPVRSCIEWLQTVDEIPHFGACVWLALVSLINDGYASCKLASIQRVATLVEDLPTDLQALVMLAREITLPR